MIISVSHLKKYYQVWQKEPGILGSLKALVKKKHQEVRAVDDISFEIKEGELVGFIGPNGAGKTTTLKCLSGLLYPTSGEVNVLGFNPYERKKEFLNQISLVMGQKNQLWWDLPAMETFLLNKEIYEIAGDKFAKNLEILTKLLEVKSLLKTPVRRLSLGERMKMELIASLLPSPKILFLDEPTLGLDIISQKKMRDFIAEYNQIYKATIILTSHYMDDVKELAQRVIVINGGKIIYDGILDKLVEKYAKEKIISLVFAKEIDGRELEKIGKLKQFNFPQAVVLVKRERAAQVAAQILQQFPVADLNIEEEPIEDIISKVFAKE